ncbi:carbohydrate kinase family protein [Thermanaeromonas sp. C210]|uniref:carbohydrate kinase family protein n=1 Tax=Thermanaeromonas sp. C210 TaxID=2731925 RepID=UPI00155D0EF5|nr:carbohydrate kinase family protein [Thermanaeromonas sp. C210]GFN22355.1 hypothetical protein TAMC210_06710 [Thermanaeromonas sp. C210]
MDTNLFRGRTVFIGHLTLDDVVLPDGRTYFDSPGGAALYAAAGAILWCSETRGVGLVARIGHDYNNAIISRLKDLGLDLTGIVRTDDATIHIWALYDRKGYRYFIPQIGGGRYEQLAPRPEDIPVTFLKEAVGFHVAPMPLPSQEQIIEKLGSTGKVILLDPHHEWVEPRHWERWRRILRTIDVFLPSEDELAGLMGLDGRLESIEHYKVHLQELAGMGPRIVALKLGERGVLLYDADKGAFCHVPSAAEKVVDVTGAGDAFCGGFLEGLVETNDPITAALYGTVSASVALEDFGAISILQYDREIIRKRLAKLKEMLAAAGC